LSYASHHAVLCLTETAYSHSAALSNNCGIHILGGCSQDLCSTVLLLPLSKGRHETYTCPSSCAIVYAVLIPLSSTKAQLLDGLHIVASSARPRVNESKTNQLGKNEKGSPLSWHQKREISLCKDARLFCESKMFL